MPSLKEESLVVIPRSDDNGGMIEIHVRYYRRHSLLRGGIFYFFVRAGKWGEVTSKCAKPGENRNESVRGTLGREKKRREELPSFRPSVVPCAPPIFHFSCFFFRPPPLKEPLWRREDATRERLSN